jgi:hypothetical protein
MTIIKLVENEKPKIDKINFSCDEKICPKLDDYPMVRDNLNFYNTTVLLGRQNSGKTSLTINFVLKLYKKKFHKIYVFMPASSRASLKKNIFDALPPEQVFDELTPANIQQLYEEIKTNSEEGKKSLVIMDDVQKALRDPFIIGQFKNMVANQRHLKVVNLILLQNYFALHPQIREIINNLIFFKMDKKQSTKIFDEVAELPKDVFLTLNDFIFDEPHNWCLINQKNKKIYKMWDEIIIDDEDDDE